MANKKLYKKERFSGCIVGAAAGDALGSPVKTLTISQIKDLYGKKGILKLSPEKRQKTARISDETQMMLFTAHGILSVSYTHLGLRYDNTARNMGKRTPCTAFSYTFRPAVY